MDSKEIAYIILTFALVATFIGIFFFTYVSKVEGKIVKSQIEKIVEDLVKSAKIVLSPEQKANVGEIVKTSLKAPDMSKEDDEVAKSNSELLKKAIKVFSILVGLSVFVVVMLWLRSRFDAVDVVKSSVFILALVALTEFLFVTYVSQNYIMVDSNYVKYVVLTALQKYSSEA